MNERTAADILRDLAGTLHVYADDLALQADHDPFSEDAVAPLMTEPIVAIGKSVKAWREELARRESRGVWR